jgi:hypothetical protein
MQLRGVSQVCWKQERGMFPTMQAWLGHLFALFSPSHFLTASVDNSWLRHSAASTAGGEIHTCSWTSSSLYAGRVMVVEIEQSHGDGDVRAREAATLQLPTSHDKWRNGFDSVASKWEQERGRTDEICSMWGRPCLRLIQLRHRRWE